MVGVVLVQVRFNKYGKDQIMSKHCDHIHSLFDLVKHRGIPVLSIVGVLNDDYKGGEFIMFDDYEIKFKSGDLVIFPSVFLYPHLVKPVKKGIRYLYLGFINERSEIQGIFPVPIYMSELNRAFYKKRITICKGTKKEVIKIQVILIPKDNYILNRKEFKNIKKFLDECCKDYLEKVIVLKIILKFILLNLG